MVSLPPLVWLSLVLIPLCLACEDSKGTAGNTSSVTVSPKESGPISHHPSGDPLPALARVEDATFHATIDRVDAVYTPQRIGQLRITVAAKPPYHVNAEYPHRFTVDEERGLRASSRVIAGTALQISSERLVVPLSVTPDHPGEARIAGELKFSVCTDERCVMEKRRLGLGFPVGQSEAVPPANPR